ncbi:MULTISPECIES: virulence-associated E family protein [unclassified Bradyrhizobium]|uniref:virulence-associated E family protein n=1 Tax=unclassified Bradyrhizobium TaxID=2631580 RepID=UPI001FF823A8|nr:MULTISPECIES: virulence-associated E family protein [unclassified Bradyrhizobium]MCK1669249.1 virulence protein E [Bradyrhizobium sp. 153]MCK1755855.1 virulence protein E [Bradyrhizobium sp. 137]
MKDDSQVVLIRRRYLVTWRETAKGGFGIPSLYNARIAIDALGIECSYDTFHEKLLVGFKGDAAKHELTQIEGEVSDHVIIRLRQILSEQYGFDFTEQYVRDAVISLALENCFDPVCDMLDEAEADWDGIERLDAMAVDYFKAADTKLNRAFVRKMMIAAVRRARHPGCKFDNIVVFESPEGWFKSTAIRILAGDENFSDQSILGAKDREIQEQLAEVWIHENADLAGMKKAEVEQVKAYASRQIDRGRPAYGRFPKKQPRHCIDVGTTNKMSEYLQSPDGNRRFWPVKITKCVDLEKLQRDRLQLWGEAARCESQGESITLGELWNDAVKAQEQRRVKDSWEPVLASLTPQKVVADPDGFEKKVVHEVKKAEVNGQVSTQWRASTADLLNFALGLRPGHQNRGHSMRLSDAMRNIGWERHSHGKVTIDDKQVNGYFCDVYCYPQKS